MQGRPGIRVLLVISSLGGAGAENQLVHLAIGLARAGHEVTIVALRLVRRDVAPLSAAGVTVLALGRRGQATRPLVMFPLVRLARRSDVVHCTSWDASLWGRMAALIARRPVIVTEHTPHRDVQISMRGAPRGRWIARHNRLLAPVTYAMVAVGRSQVALLQREGLPPERLAYIPNAVPVDELRRASGEGVGRKELGIPAEARLVVHVARFASMKNQLQTFETVQRLRERFGDVHALFVGEGETRKGLELRARRAGADWAHFVGRRSDVPRLLALSDVAALPSSAEGMPMVVLEALAVGTPMVATDVGDVRLVLESSGAGICVAPGDSDAFTDACGTVLADETTRRRLVDAARAAASRFDASVMTSRYAELITAAVEGRPLPETLRPAGDGGSAPA